MPNTNDQMINCQPRRIRSRRIRKKGRLRDFRIELIPKKTKRIMMTMAIQKAVRVAVWMSRDMFGYYRIAQRAYTFNGDFHKIAGQQRADAGRGASHDDVS